MNPLAWLNKRRDEFCRGVINGVRISFESHSLSDKDILLISWALTNFIIGIPLLIVTFMAMLLS
jgi:hypothetical protein